MSYVEKHLDKDEVIKYRGKLHRNMYAIGYLFAFISLMCFFSLDLGGVLFGIPLAIFSFLYIRSIAAAEIVITNKRVIIKTGLITNRLFEMNFAKIESIEIQQPMGSSADYGTLIISGTGGTKKKFPSLDKPFEFKRAFNEIAGAK